MRSGFMQCLFSQSFKVQMGLLSLLVLGLVGVAAAQEEHAGGTAAHGGFVTKTQRHQFEVVFRKDGLAVYPSGSDGKAIDATQLSGTATFYHPSSPQPWFARPLRGVAPSRAMAVSLDLDMDLRQIPTAGAKVTFQLMGLPDPAETTATFTVPFTLSGAAEVKFARATPADQKAIAAQRVCLVSGEALGSMGTPIKATRGDRSTFLCCAGCEKKIQADPDKFLGAPTAAAAKGREHAR